jgi:hypothetical protein
MYKLLSGAKSVKQYRGDENLPEAKNGMKKNCGCKHTRSKYKYQEGTENLDLEVDNDPEIIELNKKIKEFDDRMSGKSKPKPAEKKTSVIENKPVARMQTPVVAKTKIAVPVTKTVKTVQQNKVQPVKKTVIRNYAKAKKETQVFQDPTKHSGLAAYHKYKDFQTQAENLSKKVDKNIKAKNNFNNKNLNAITADFKNRINNANKGNFSSKEEKEKTLLNLNETLKYKTDSVNVNSLDYANDQRKKVRDINISQMEYLKGLQGKDKEFVENALRGPQQNEERQKLKKETEAYQQELQRRRNKTSSEKSADVKRYEAERREKENNPSFLDTVKYAFTGKYKYGTGALEIPEGSAIVTANGGKNKQALMAYKKGNYKLLNKIISKMPEDNNPKKQAGDPDVAPSLTAFKFKEKATPAPQLTETDPTRRRYQELAQKGKLTDAEEDELVNLRDSFKDSEDVYTDDRIAEKFGKDYDIDDPKNRSYFDNKGKLVLKEDKENSDYREQLRDKAFRDAEIKAGNVVIKNGEITYKAKGKEKKGQMEFLGTTASTRPNIPGETSSKKPQGWSDFNKVPEGSSNNTGDGNDSFASNKKGGNFLANIPSLAEVAAKSSLLAQGVEGVPENYLKLGRYNYASQLPQTLREIQLAEQGGRESARDIVGGDAGRYLAQAGALSSARMKASNEAVIQDTLARQDILNKNVDKGDEENKINTGLKNQYATQRSANRGAYNNMLVSLGQSIDTATDASKLMASQKESDDVRTNLLKTGNYHMDKEGNVHMNKAKKGAKKLKTYKRK